MIGAALFNDLKLLMSAYLPDTVFPKVEAAFKLAEQAHSGQTRKSGEPYIMHPLAVAVILAELHQDVDSIMAALLHDTLEDTALSEGQLLESTNQTVLELVQGVTKLGSVYFGSKEQEQAQNFRKLFLAMAKDLRVVIIKLADRLHNMRTLDVLPVEKQKRISRETMDIFSPLSHRLGMGNIKWELEDLSFLYLEPEQFQIVKELVSTKRTERESYISKFIEHVNELLMESSVMADVFGRPKHFYSIHKKLTNLDIPFDELYDLLGIRIITETEADCYQILGTIHSKYKPVSGRIKDYIAMPKTNMYQSLHTTVIGPEGKPIEIQIRTKGMNAVAENGVAAHWQYKEGGMQKQSVEHSVDFGWLQDILASEKEDPEHYLEHLKLDLFADEVFVFTPDGEIKVFHSGATPLDFAYKVHTDVGHRCTGAKANGVIVPLSYKLRSGDRIEILTQKNANPKLAWLKLATSRHAQGKIKAWFKRQDAEMEKEKGRLELEEAIVAKGVSLKDVLKEEIFSDIFEKYALHNFDELYLKIAYDEVSIRFIVQELSKKLGWNEQVPTEDVINEVKTQKKPQTTGVIVLGERNVETYFAKCCRPLPGDDVVGYVTVGHGIAVHRSNCTNITKIKGPDEARVVDVEWETVDGRQGFPVVLRVETFERPNLLNDIVTCILDAKMELVGITSTEPRDGHLLVNVEVLLDHSDSLEKVKQLIMAMPDVLSVTRARNL